MVVEVISSQLKIPDTGEQRRIARLPEKAKGWFEYGQIAQKLPPAAKKQRASFYNRQLVLYSEFKDGDLEKLVDFLCWRQQRRHERLGMVERQPGQGKKPRPVGLEAYIDTLCQEQQRRHTRLGLSVK